MSAYIPQMRTQSEGLRNTVQNSCTKSYTVSNKFNNIETYGSKLRLKQDTSFQLLFENIHGLLPDMGYCSTSWKYKHLRYMISRFQIDTLYLAEMQINLALTPYTFSLRDKLFQSKEPVLILSHNRNEYLGMRQQSGVFTGIISQALSIAISTRSDSTGLGRWNWI